MPKRRQRTRLHLRYQGKPDRHYVAAAGLERSGDSVQRFADQAELARGYFRRPCQEARMNHRAVKAIYTFEMARAWRTVAQSIVSPVLSTSLYFVVFGAAIGSRITQINGVSYGAFIVPGLVMLSLLTQSVANASFGIYFPKFTGTIYEL